MQIHGLRMDSCCHRCFVRALGYLVIRGGQVSFLCEGCIEEVRQKAELGRKTLEVLQPQSDVVPLAGELR